MKRRRSKIQTEKGCRRWYLLIHQLPPEPLYLRAKIRQRLSRVGAVALKNSVYALPVRDESLEDFQWIGEEANAGGGEAYVCEAEFLDKNLDEELVRRSRDDRDADYAALSETIRGWKREAGAELPARAARARRQFEEIERVDFFGAPRRKEAQKLLSEIEALGRRPPRRPAPGHESLAGRTWATRKGLHIDRLASAWLIRRFIDPRARFRFVDPKEPPRKGEIRFDMVGGDYTHEGDRCTFETLVGRTGLSDRGLREIGEIVHDIDLKDEKFGRNEAPGVERLVTGLILANPGDSERLDRGLVLFDELYRSFRGRNPLFAKEVSK
jgi:hypothetical protein